MAFVSALLGVLLGIALLTLLIGGVAWFVSGGPAVKVSTSYGTSASAQQAQEALRESLIEQRLFLTHTVVEADGVLRATRQHVPFWAAALMVSVFPVGLLFLVIRREESLEVTVEPRGDGAGDGAGASVLISGRSTLRSARTLGSLIRASLRQAGPATTPPVDALPDA